MGNGVIVHPQPSSLNPSNRLSSAQNQYPPTRKMGRPETMRVRGVEASDCLDFSGETVYGDFRDDLVKDGFAVIKAIDPKKAAEHADKFHQYMEDL
jgi:hypothetical protein